jgi:large subunit ribosomal protein L24
MAAKIKKGDLVEVVTGKYKGQRGRVMRVKADDNRVWVEKINIVQRHTRGLPGQTESEIVNKEAPIDLSNVMIVDPESDRPSRVGFRFVDEVSEEERARANEQGVRIKPRKVRFAKRSGATLD